MNELDVIVVGVGAMGAAACYALAKRGSKVLGIEQFDIANALGSSHGHVRMTRTAYYEHTDYVPLILRANALWRELEDEIGDTLLHQVGGIYLGRQDGEVISGSLRSAREHQLPHEFLPHDMIARRYPQFCLPPDYVGIFEPAAGYLLAERCVAGMAHAAMMRGAEIHGREKVIAWEPGIVRTDRAEYRCRRIVFCGGSWTSKLIGDLGIPLHVTRQVIAWFWPAKPERFAAGPVWGIERPEGLYYGFPMRAEMPGVRFALHAQGVPIDPDAVERGEITAETEMLRKFIMQILPDAEGPLLSAKTCLYTNSPDHHFILGKHPRMNDVILAAGFSGHGFKFATAIGEALAELALEGKSRLPIGFLSPTRFM
jgi:sarcosine oxidase